MQALIHMESIQSQPKQIDRLDSLVEKFISPSPDNLSPASYAEREEFSSIFLEVTLYTLIFFLSILSLEVVLWKLKPDYI